jgi:hypothetical protein
MKYELTIVIEVKDDFNPAHLNILDHDVCDGFEVLLDHESDDFKLISFGLVDVKKLNGTANEDIQDVAKRLNMLQLSESQLNWVRLSYEDAKRQDPTATWDLIVEDLLYQLQEFSSNTTAEPDRFTTDGDGDDETLLNFMG